MAARASSCNSIQLQFVSKLVRLSPQPPTTRPTSVEQRLITGHHFLFIAATWATTTYLSSSQCPAAFFHDGKQPDQKPRSLCRHSVHLRRGWQPGVTSVAAGVRLFARDFSNSTAPKHAAPSAPVPDPDGFLMTSNLTLLTSVLDFLQLPPNDLRQSAVMLPRPPFPL